jgi:hypothetical protein
MNLIHTLHKNKFGLVNLDTFDHNNQMITLSMIKLSSIQCKSHFLLITNPGYNEQIELVPWSSL